MYMNSLVKIKNKKTYEFPYDVIWIYPLDLKDEQILKDNLAKSETLLKELIKAMDKKQLNENILQNLRFDIEKEIPLKMIERCNDEIDDIIEELNQNLSPYYWSISKDHRGGCIEYDISEYMEADFLLVLCKRK